MPQLATSLCVRRSSSSADTVYLYIRRNTACVWPQKVGVTCQDVVWEPMIIPSPSDIQAKVALASVSDDSTTSNGPKVAPPPIHPALQYGLSASTISPPGYQTTRKPFSTITYTFWQRSEVPNCMVLSPPLDLLNVRPTYHISVTMNCFTPSSCITTIRRDSIQGEFVGDFEMGLTNKKASTVCIRGNEYPISDLLESGYRPFKNTWVWKTPEFEKPSSLYWDDSSGPGITCFSSKDKVNNNLLARFLPPTHPRKVGRPTEMTRLEISPQGHELFDDILISALILERMRTTPSV